VPEPDADLTRAHARVHVSPVSPDANREPGRPWGWWLLLVLLAIGWAVLRLSMNREFHGAKWSTLLSFEAPLPFGHRVLVPLLARPLVSAGVDVPMAWGVFEVGATVALVLCIERMLAMHLPARAARLLSACVLGVLPLAYLLPHRWAIYYPWDAAAMAFVAAGVLLAQQRRFAMALIVTAIAAVNRESAVLIPASVVVLSLHDSSLRRRALPWAGLMSVAYVAVRWGIALALPNNRGPSLHTALEGRYRVFNNLEWLADPAHAVTFVGSLGFLPLLWLAVRRHVPADVQRLHVPALAAVLGLTVIANVYEPRAFGEAIVLAWLAVAVGLGRWLCAIDEPEMPRPAWLVIFDRAAALMLAAGWILFILALRHWAFLPLLP
jgi:hypothetical protein